MAEQIEKYRVITNQTAKKLSFILADGQSGQEVLQTQLGNRDIFTLPCLFDKPDILSARNYYLYFVLRASSLEDIREPAIETCFYISENFNIPQDCTEVIYTGGGSGLGIGPAAAAGSTADKSSENSKEAANTNNSAAEMIILTPPVVFDGQPTPLMPTINYKLARQLVEDGIENVDIDIYQRNYLIRLPNSFNSETGSYVIPLTIKEPLYMDASAIAELSKQPRAEDFMTFPTKDPEAAEWFNEILKESTNRKKAQDELLKLILRDGWQISPCIRQLLWADLSKEQAFEACRVISGFFSWIKASPNEIWYHFQRIDKRNHIADYQRLRAILNFASENPGFVGCDHKLLASFCPAGKCFMAELISEYECPSLFQ